MCIVTTTALAAQPTLPGMAPDTYRFARINVFHVDLSISNAGLANCYALVKLLFTSDTVKLSITLQRQSGSSWSEVKSWSTSGSGSVSLEKEWYVTTGTYRVYATAQVYNSSGTLLETAIAISNSVQY